MLGVVTGNKRLNKSIINDAIKLVIINIINVFLNIFVSLFILDILLILDTIVVNTSGTTKVNIKFKNMSPSGFMFSEKFGKNIPTILPSIIDTISNIGNI